MTPTPEKPKRKSVPIKMEQGAVEITCKTCRHHAPTLDEVPSLCWDCVAQGMAIGGVLPFWTPKDE